MNRYKIRDLILVNLIAVICLGIIILLLNSSLPAMALCLLVWLVIAVVLNYMLLLGGQKKNKNKIADRRKLFPSEVAALKRAQESINLRRETFEKLPPDDKLRETYELISQQVYSNIKSAAAFIESYDYINKPSIAYLHELCRDNEHLLTQLSELVEYQIKLESTVDDIDTDKIDSMLEALKDTVDNRVTY